MVKVYKAFFEIYEKWLVEIRKENGKYKIIQYLFEDEDNNDKKTKKKQKTTKEVKNDKELGEKFKKMLLYLDKNKELNSIEEVKKVAKTVYENRFIEYPLTEEEFIEYVVKCVENGWEYSNDKRGDEK